MKKITAWLRRHKVLGGLGILVAVFLIVTNIDSPRVDEGETPGTQTPDWDAVRASDLIKVSDGWSTPVLLAVSEDGKWGDSISVTLDGSRIYFMYYPGDLLSDALKGEFSSNANVYYSDTPFMTKKKDTRYYLAEHPWTAAGPTVASDGDIYYHSNRPITGDNDRHLAHLYRNTDLLPFNNPDLQYTNPHYCVAKDELWFDRDDHEIYVLRKAKASGFTGTPELAPKPLNSHAVGLQEAQPWLSEDCNTMYFTSNREHVGLGPFIYRSVRLGENTWGVPVVQAKSAIGVGEPTLTRDMKKMFFEQVLRNAKGEFTTTFFSSERK